VTADIVLREAEAKAQRVRAGADSYAQAVLADLEARLATALGSVRKGQDALVPRAPQAAAPAPMTEAVARSKRAAFDAQDDAVELDVLEVHR